MSEAPRPAHSPEMVIPGLTDEQQERAHLLYVHAIDAGSALRTTLYEQEQYKIYRRLTANTNPPNIFNIAGNTGLDVILGAVLDKTARAYRQLGVYRAVRAAKKDYKQNREAYHQTALNEAGFDNADINFAGGVARNVRRLRSNLK